MIQKKQLRKKKKGRMPRTSVSFPPKTFQDLERIAEGRKVSVAWVVREAVDRYLAAETIALDRMK
jgi:predicted transcriptional regulator